MRYSAATLKGESHKGVMGVGIHVKAGGGAHGIAQTTKDVLIRFCTKFAHMPTPHSARPPLKPKFHQQLLEHIRLSTEIFGLDAAADEVKAVRTLGPLG